MTSEAQLGQEQRMEICPECNGAGGDNQHTVCGKCNGSGGVPTADLGEDRQCSCAEIAGEDPRCILHGEGTRWRKENPDLCEVSDRLILYREALEAVIARAPERDLKWAGMTARDIAIAVLSRSGG